MDSSFEEIKNHFEFLGYSIEQHEITGSKVSYFLATHPRIDNIVFLEICPKFIQFQMRFSLNKIHTEEMDVYINKLNSLLSISKAYIDSPSENDEVSIIHINAVYSGEYVKPLFGAFYGLYISDRHLIYTLENFEKIFKEN